MSALSTGAHVLLTEAVADAGDGGLSREGTLDYKLTAAALKVLLSINASYETLVAQGATAAFVQGQLLAYTATGALLTANDRATGMFNMAALVAETATNA